MKKKFKLALASLTTLSLLSLSACGNDDTNKNNSNNSNDQEATGTTEFEDPGTIKIYFFNEGDNVDKVVKKFEEETQDTLNTKIDFNWTTDHKQEMPLKIAAGEQIDLTFDAYWQNLAKNKGDGVYADLSQYFENDDYPGLKKAFPSDILDLVREKDGSIYSIPLIAINGQQQAQGFIVDGNLREKYDLPPVTDDATFKQYLETMYENSEEEGLTSVLSLWGLGYGAYLGQTNEKLLNNIVTVSGFDIQLSDDGTTVEGILGLGDDDNSAEKFKGDFKGRNYLRERLEVLADDYGKYVDENALSGDSTGTVKTAGTFTFLTEWAAKKKDAEAKGEKPELYIAQKEMNEGSGTVVNDMTTANNFMVIPSYSKNIDRTMAFLNWIFDSQENWDLWNHGIKGEDFEAVGEKEYSPLEPQDKYTFPTYEMTDNSTYTRIDASLDDYAKSLYEFCLDINNFESNPLAGFSFDPSTTPQLKQAYASYNTTSGDYNGYFQTGLYKENFEEKYQEYVGKTQKDAELVKEELQKQVQEFLDARN